MSRRYKRVGIREEQIDDFFSGNLSCIDGLPDDVSVVKTYDEPMYDTYWFVLESEQFPVVEPGNEIPEADIVVAERRVSQHTHYVCPNCHDTFDNGDVKP